MTWGSSASTLILLKGYQIMDGTEPIDGLLCDLRAHPNPVTSLDPPRATQLNGAALSWIEIL